MWVARFARLRQIPSMSEQSKNTKRRLRAQLGPLGLSLILALAVVPPAQADSSANLKAALAAVAQADWATASAALPAGSVAGDIVEWHRLRAGEGRLSEYEAFLARRPDWPGLPLLKEKGEEAVARSTDPARVLAYFGTGMAETAQGALATIKALRATGRAAEAEAEAFRAWADLPFGADQEAELLGLYGDTLQSAHAARLDTLLWQGRFAEAGRMLDRVDAGRAALAQARMGLRNDADGVNVLIERVPAALQDDPGLAFERFDWRLRRDRTDDAAALILERSTSAQGLGDPDAWGDRRADLVRALLREGKPKLAYRVAASHQMQGGQTYADLEFLSGFIALRRLNDPATALKHFRALGQAVATPISIARAQYWQGRALLAAGDKAAAVQALQAAAQNQTAYYGLLAAETLGLSLDPSLLSSNRPADWQGASFAQSSVLEAALLLDKAGDRTLSKRFFLHLGESLTDPELAQLADLALRIDEPHIAVVIAKQAAERGLILPDAYFPVPEFVPDGLAVSRAFALAISRRESEFDPAARSSADARGLMQVLPSTAEHVAPRVGLTYDAKRLNDPAYNVQIGSGYLAELVAKFGPSVALVASGYNAGPGRPVRWMETLGDPRDPSVDVVDWVEMIPFTETRTYVMRVSESLVIYRAKLKGQSIPVRITDELRG
jgi:soluble lytic murein transglycosylase